MHLFEALSRDAPAAEELLDLSSSGNVNDEQRLEIADTPLWLVELFSFCRDVSVVGASKLVRSSPTPLPRLIWMLLLLAGLAFTVHQFQDRISYYYSYPVNVAVSVEYVDEIRFPMTTICNENRVGKQVAEIYNEVQLFESLFPAFPMPSFQPDWSVYDIKMQRIQIDWDILYANTGQSQEQAIFTCSYNSEACNISGDFIRILTDFGYCIAFNTADSNHTSTATGSTSGLQMILFVNQADYMATNSYSAGFRVLLQEPHETPLIYQLAFKIAPGYTTQVAVNTAVMIETPPPYGDCDDTSNYTQTYCLAKCQGKYVTDRCGCKDGSQPGSARVCTPKLYYQCWFPSMTKFVTDNVAATCGCRRQCRKTTYNYVATQSEFSEHMIAYIRNNWNLNISSAEWRLNYAAIEVYFSELKYTYTTSSPAYLGLTLLCDVGGALGLILGSTILTVCEVVDLLLTMAVTHVQRSAWKWLIGRRRQRQPQRQRVAPVPPEIIVSEIEVEDLE